MSSSHITVIQKKTLVKNNQVRAGRTEMRTYLMHMGFHLRWSSIRWCRGYSGWPPSSLAIQWWWWWSMLWWFCIVEAVVCVVVKVKRHLFGVSGGKIIVIVNVVVAVGIDVVTHHMEGHESGT